MPETVRVLVVGIRLQGGINDQTHRDEKKPRGQINAQIPLTDRQEAILPVIPEPPEEDDRNSARGGHREDPKRAPIRRRPERQEDRPDHVEEGRVEGGQVGHRDQRHPDGQQGREEVGELKDGHLGYAEAHDVLARVAGVVERREETQTSVNYTLDEILPSERDVSRRDEGNVAQDQEEQFRQDRAVRVGQGIVHTVPS